MPSLHPLLPRSLPYLTADLPGIGGVLKQQVEDFEVEEIPAYEPSGEGEFLYLWVEKRGLSAEQMVSHLARFLNCAHQDLGTAGLKDRHAVTRQWVSVPVRCSGMLDSIQHPQFRILKAVRHRNKLRAGHLRGNRFGIVVRNVLPDSLSRAQAIRERVLRSGFPNYFGDQRFGSDSETLQLGQELLAGTKTPGDIPRARRKFLLRLSLSAVQSALFNCLLTERLEAGTLETVLPGEVLQVVASGGPFVTDDPAREQQRFLAKEIVPAGPLFGPKMKPAASTVAELESRLLRETGLPADSFTKYALLTSGARRPYLIFLQDLGIQEVPEGLRFEFTLPSGCYATVLLREFQKNEA